MHTPFHALHDCETHFSVAELILLTGSFFNPIHRVLDRRVYVFDLGMFLQKIVQPVLVLAEPLQFLVRQII